MAVQPIFIFSVSRSGSTLLQRVIAAHDGVATASEPWLLLPHAYALRPAGVQAEYFHPLLVTALEDFCRTLPAGMEDYRRGVREFALGLYERAAGDDARYFLDKSPAYYLIAEEVMRLFPEGRFIFLWRHPLAVMASIMQTFHGGRWHPTLFRSDMFVGLPRLISAYRANASRAHSIRYEDLVDGREGPWRSLMEYLDLELEPGALERFSQVRLTGRMGDPTGVTRYTNLSSEPLHKWRRTLASPLRRECCRRYLNFLGADRLAAIGYDAEEIARELDAQPPALRGLSGDIGRLVLDVAKEPVRVRLRRGGVGGPNVIRQLLAA